MIGQNECEYEKTVTNPSLSQWVGSGKFSGVGRKQVEEDDRAQEHHDEEGALHVLRGRRAPRSSRSRRRGGRHRRQRSVSRQSGRGARVGGGGMNRLGSALLQWHQVRVVGGRGRRHASTAVTLFPEVADDWLIVIIARETVAGHVKEHQDCGEHGGLVQIRRYLLPGEEVVLFVLGEVRLGWKGRKEREKRGYNDYLKASRPASHILYYILKFSGIVLFAAAFISVLIVFLLFGAWLHKVGKENTETVENNEENIQKLAEVGYRNWLQVWWILLHLFLTTSASTCLQHSRNPGVTWEHCFIYDIQWEAKALD